MHFISQLLVNAIDEKSSSSVMADENERQFDSFIIDCQLLDGYLFRMRVSWRIMFI